MSGISIEVEIEDSAARARLEAMVARMENPLGFYKNVGEHMVLSTHHNFEAETAPDGVPWKKLMPATIRRRQKRGRSALKILRDSGVLKGSISAEPANAQVTVGANTPYAAIHQLGGKIEKPERHAVIHRSYNIKTDTFGRGFRKKSKSNFSQDVKIPAHTINIPARPFLGISAPDAEAIIEIADDWLRG